mgnify:CR=1 FL=1
MKTVTYLCKWSSGLGKYLEWEDFRTVDKSFFNDDNGYDDSHKHMISLLQVGDRVDLSDGISQYHEVERLA